jgi:hypothetical protein
VGDTPTHRDKNIILSYIYLRFPDIKKITLFSIEATDNDVDEHIFGCLIESEDEAVIMDKTGMTAQPRARESEIADILVHIYANKLDDRLHIIDKKVTYTGDLNPENACKILQGEASSLIGHRNILDLVGLIRGHMQCVAAIEDKK